MDWEEGLYKGASALEDLILLTSEIPSQHEIQHEETVLVVLESIAKVYNEWVIDLWKA